MRSDNTPSISVIVPIYGIAEFLPQCIESILTQTFQDFELILVDDGSTDGCYEICEAYGNRDERIYIIHKSNGGLVSARKTGISASSGKYIAYVDGDDWIEPDYLERLYYAAKEEKVDVVLCGRYEETGGYGRKMFHGFAAGRYGENAIRESILPKLCVTFQHTGLFPHLWGKLFRRELLFPFQMGVDERIRMSEDSVCFYPCMLKVKSIFLLEEYLYHYRQSDTSMVKQMGDSHTERQRYRILYENGITQFSAYRDIYDLSSEWRAFLLFLMVPRADVLYEGIEELPYLFPFPKVKKGERVILYGMGLFGQRLYHYLLRTGFCQVAAVADRNYKGLREMGLPVIAPEEIEEYEYDAIVVTNSYAETRKRIYEDLTEFCPAEKVHLVDEELIHREETFEAFGID